MAARRGGCRKPGAYRDFERDVYYNRTRVSVLEAYESGSF